MMRCKESQEPKNMDRRQSLKRNTRRCAEGRLWWPIASFHTEKGQQEVLGLLWARAGCVAALGARVAGRLWQSLFRSWTIVIMESTMSTGKAAKLLGVSVKTLQR
jgi:hypothetical protein